VCNHSATNSRLIAPAMPNNDDRSYAPFHLSLHVNDLTNSRKFYGGILGCPEGRSTASWVDFDFFGNQLSLHVGTPTQPTQTGKVADVTVPMPHFGAVLPLADWQQLAERLSEHPDYLIMAPMERYASEQGHQLTLFCRDPSGNALEFKAMNTGAALFDG